MTKPKRHEDPLYVVQIASNFDAGRPAPRPIPVPVLFGPYFSRVDAKAAADAWNEVNAEGYLLFAFARLMRTPQELRVWAPAGVNQAHSGESAASPPSEDTGAG